MAAAGNHLNSNQEKKQSETDEGPVQWLRPFLEARYTRLGPRPKLTAGQEKQLEEQITKRKNEIILELLGQPGEQVDKGNKSRRPVAPKDFESVLQPGRGAEVLARVPMNYWQDLFLQYRQRLAAGDRTKRHGSHRTPDALGILGTTNWIPIGPSGVAMGQVTGRPPISGRADRIAISPDGMRVYVATADGGVWRSDDGGNQWAFTMDNFDLDPTAPDATSLACGAIAIVETNPDIVYVGTGEGDTNEVFRGRLVFGLPGYRGVGPIRSGDGGAHWNSELTAPGSPSLVGSAFFDLAVDPGDPENVVAATNIGLYRREPDGLGAYHWVQKAAGIYSCVTVARSGATTTFFAAAWSDQVYSSNDGSSWAPLGMGFPTGTSRIGLAVQHDNPNVLYAMAADNLSYALLSVYRLDNSSGAWHPVSGAPVDVLGDQGYYDLAITIDPNNVDTIYMAGQASDTGDGAIYRASLTSSGSGPSLSYAMSPTFIGTGVHADVHMLKHQPGSSSTLFVCCDGGVFKTGDAAGAALFQSCNVGLGTLSSLFMAQHPTQPAVIFLGLQDNGTARYTGEECWHSVAEGDGGRCLVNWNDPSQVLVYQDGDLLRATDGGQGWDSFEPNVVTPPGTPNRLALGPTMTGALATTSYNPGSPAEAGLVAFAGSLLDTTDPMNEIYLGDFVFISPDFGSTWPVQIPVPTMETIYCLTFTSATRLFAGMTNGRVYRLDLGGGTWTPVRIDNAAGGALVLDGLVTSIAIDWDDASRQSVYITFGGTGDYRHVWHYDGTAWQPRSGPAAGFMTSLLDVETNTIVVDRDHTTTLYAGADIGVWKSIDAGLHWSTLENGLPDAAVLDLQIHEASRLLRAALHGRGVFQYKLDPPAAHDVEVYVRDTPLDLGLAPTVDGLDDPTQWPVVGVAHWESPNIKVDAPTLAGYQTPTTSINFYEFNDGIVDGSQNVGTLDPAGGTVYNRVYVEVHNRGIQVAPSVQVMLLLTNASTVLNPLPSGYTASIQAGTPISVPGIWQTVGIHTITNLQVGIPQVAEFNLPSTMLPPPASLPGQSHFCALAILHENPDDPFTNPETDVNALTVADRKVGQKNLHLVQFMGIPPTPGMWTDIHMHSLRLGLDTYDLHFDLRNYPGRVGLLLPQELLNEHMLKGQKLGSEKLVNLWVEKQRKHLVDFMRQGRFNYELCKRMLADIEHVASQPLILFEGGRENILHGLTIQPGAAYTAFIHIEPPVGARPGQDFRFRVIQKGQAKGSPLGGSTYLVQIVKLPK